ncbi:hypothetical protein GCM10019059_26810 [Camelimonas fluminis]|uniref:XRE family transcriptional regulator n=1 Tax=Camelimonas fluminis TaxID=1576911 RepID=A0ABV7UN31_9HYPH|nr:XRE family transcriptional regulator [Camelimonas fluminis]GHE65658.1 hypothetical protein GCM10019059_26810 [Camelimonas fluminis]
MINETITGAQCAAARALTQTGIATLARRSGMDEGRIRTFEAGSTPPDAPGLLALQKALEDLGAHFIPEDEMGVGVRLRFTQSVSRKISTWENEGGAAGEDDIPG